MVDVYSKDYLLMIGIGIAMFGFVIFLDQDFDLSLQNILGGTLLIFGIGLVLFRYFKLKNKKKSENS